jgi:methyltransferase
MSSPVVPLGALAVVLTVMAAEARLSQQNERALRRRGALEPSDDVYRMMRWAYPTAFVVMAVEGAMFGMQPGPATIAGTLLFGASKALKFWAIASLRDRWTFRVLVIPGAPLVRHGPYAMLRHPNYLAVVGELVSMALFVGARATGPVTVLLFGLLLRRRIRTEEQMLGICLAHEHQGEPEPDR